MKTLHKFLILILSLFLSVFFSIAVFAWSEHPMLAHPALKGLPLWNRLDAVAAKNLKTFLVEAEPQLEQFLAQQEAWSRANLPNYAPRPDELAFKATGNPDDILYRFYTAIRVNPHIKVPLYLHLLPNDDTKGRTVADPRHITTLKDISSMLNTTYVWISEGELLLPLDVLSAGNDEPDYGFDLGLFADNNTDYGTVYGFGSQAFGNPNLEYSSQAPFHMGFYHEAKILYKFGPFLKRTYLDYRIQLYRAMSEFAFTNNQPYWGWRFMGWGMHYMGDISMPYHVKPLPGVSTLKMIWINLKAMLGLPAAKDNAVQLVSNRHTVLEEFQVQALRIAHQESNWDHPFLQALTNPIDHVTFSENFIVDVAAKESAQSSKNMDKYIEKYMPATMVSDPAIEVDDLPELDYIVQVVKEEKGQQAVDKITVAIAERLRFYSMHIRSYMTSILDAAGV
ncbi:MAG: hypothetical protein U1C46_03360 [Bacteroidales bacterium]|nr:hypothetical protein [Bacteroidales bacterium]MDZ4203838.1 hypothetical protein [Bacteroidales bacterium]